MYMYVTTCTMYVSTFKSEIRCEWKVVCVSHSVVKTSYCDSRSLHKQSKSCYVTHNNNNITVTSSHYIHVHIIHVQYVAIYTVHIKRCCTLHGRGGTLGRCIQWRRDAVTPTPAETEQLHPHCHVYTHNEKH